MISKATADCCLRSEGLVCCFLSLRLFGSLFFILQGMLLVHGVACDNVLGRDVDNDIVAFCRVLQTYAHSLWRGGGERDHCWYI